MPPALACTKQAWGTHVPFNGTLELRIQMRSQYAREMNLPSRIHTILCDSGTRQLSQFWKVTGKWAARRQGDPRDEISGRISAAVSRPGRQLMLAGGGRER